MRTAEIDLSQIFAGAQGHGFVVMKSLPAIPPAVGSDIDILCEDANALGRLFLRNCRPLIEAGWEVRVRQLPETGQAHIDLMRDQAIQLRLDLHEGLGCYRQTPVREGFASQILRRRAQQRLEGGADSFTLPVPEETDNLVLRYLEYHEYFHGRPDKIKHADFIAEKINRDPATVQAFFDRLSQATGRRPVEPVLQHCDINFKRQVTWALWGLRDKLSWRVARARGLATLAVTQPAVFLQKLIKRLPGHSRPVARLSQDPQ